MAQQPQHRMPVKVEQIKSRQLVDRFTLPGTLMAVTDVRISAEVPGVVEWLGAEEGDRVEAQQSLVRIDRANLDANLRQAQADAAGRQKTLVRLRSMRQENLVSQQDLDNAVAAAEAAKAVLERARLQLHKAEVHAPLAAVLERRFVDEGEYVNPGDPLVQLVDPTQLKVIVDLPEKELVHVQRGDQVEVMTTTPGEPEQAVTANIKRIAQLADPLARTYQVELALQQPDPSWRPGRVLRCRFVRQRYAHALAVPLYAVLRQAGQSKVYLYQEQKALERKVKIGAIIGTEAIITAGIKEGDQLIVRGQHLVTDGASVRLQEQH